MASGSEDIPTYRIDVYEPLGDTNTWRVTLSAPHTLREVGVVYHRSLEVALRMLYVALQDEGVDEVETE